MVRSIKAYSPSMLATGWREARERQDESDRDKCNVDEKGVTPEKINPRAPGPHWGAPRGQGLGGPLTGGFSKLPHNSFKTAW